MKLAILGYGNLGKGVEMAIRQTSDAVLVGIFTGRSPETVHSPFGSPVFGAGEMERFRDRVDVVILCGGSATDLPYRTPALAECFCVVDSFDTHADIPAHFERVDAAARRGGKTALISAGWDPGLFSLCRLYGEAILPGAGLYTFWGRGVSQGHSDAVRRIEGVLDARQYTVPAEEWIEAVRRGETPEPIVRKMHRRICYVVAKEGADRERIRRQILTMPHYFCGYHTDVIFISSEEMERDHAGLFHGGSVILSGKTGADHRQIAECRLTLDSNPEFTAGILVAAARAVHRMAQRGRVGCYTVFDLAPADLSPETPEQLRRRLL